MTYLDRQPPRARAHTCTTTTSADAHRAEVLPKHSLHSRLNNSPGQQTSVLGWIDILNTTDRPFALSDSTCSSLRSLLGGRRVDDLFPFHSFTPKSLDWDSAPYLIAKIVA